MCSNSEHQFRPLSRISTSFNHMKVSQFNDIKYSKDDSGVVTLMLNTPKRKNALSAVSFLEIYYALDTFEKDDKAHVMIITGAQDPDSNDPTKEAFSSGGYFATDVLEGLPEDVLAEIDLSDIAQKRVTMKAIMCDKPIIAAINGLAIGGGFTFAFSAADQIYASEHAWAQLPFAKLGISAELASSFLMPRLMGLHKTKEIMFFADRMTADQLLDFQLVNKVLPHSELLPYAQEQALKLAPPLGASGAIRKMKRLLHASMENQVSDALDRENQALQALFASADFAEAMGARAEKRVPVFKGC